MFWTKSDALELIELTYAMIDEQDGSQNLFRHIQRLFGDSMLCLQMWDDAIEVDSEQMILRGWDSSAIDQYVQHYSSVNPYLPLIAERKSGDVYLLSDLIRTEESSQYEFLNDFQYKNGNYAGVTATILKDDKRYGAISIDGPAHDQQRWNELVALVKVLTPHLQRVMHLSRQLRDLSLYKSVANISMNRIGACMIVVDARGRVKFANKNALKVLSGNKTLRTGMGGFLTASTVNQTRQLRQLIASSTLGDSLDAATAGGFMMLNTQDGDRQVAMITPLARGIQKRIGLVETWSVEEKHAVIFLTDPDSRPCLPSEFLIMRYELTRKEADLTMHLFTGGTLAAYCELNFVTLNTARTQLKAVFQKTGVSRQGELLALLNRMTVFADMVKSG